MSRPAPSDHPVHPLIRDRWSPRAFSDQAVSKETLFSLLEAARWSASSYNEQPWGFIVATKEQPQEYEKLLRCLIEFNQSWAKSAPALILALAHTVFDKTGKPNRHAFHDVGFAAALLTIQATSMGLYCHHMAGIEVDVIRSSYQVPPDWEPLTAIAVGHLGDPSSLPESLREREHAPRTRRALNTIVSGGPFSSGPFWKPGK